MHFISRAAFIALCAAADGCSTVTPKLIDPPKVATEVVIKQAEGFLLNQEQVDKYNRLIELGYGSEKHHFLPALKKNDGVTLQSPGVWFIDHNHAIYFEAMNQTFTSGIKP